MLDFLYTNSVMFEFATLVDIDMGVIKLAQDKFHNTKIMDKTILELEDDLSIQYLLLQREDPNPLSILLKPEYMDQATDLYKQIMDTYEMEIYKTYSSIFSTYELAKVYQETDNGLIKVYVYCRTPNQEAFMKEFDTSIPIVTGEPASLKLNGYDCIYMKSYVDFLLFKNVDGKYLNFLQYAFNLEADGRTPLVTVSSMFADTNKIRFVMPYSGLELPVDDIDDDNPPEERENDDNDDEIKRGEEETIEGDAEEYPEFYS